MATIQDLGRVVGADGPAGAPATINGVNALTIQGSDTAELSQSGSTATLSAKGWTNENILINADFRAPVNRIGKTEYSGAGWAIDRWRTGDGYTLTVQNDSALLRRNSGTSSFAQRVEHSELLLGKTMSFSVLTNEDELVEVSFTLPPEWPSSSANYAQKNLTRNGAIVASFYMRAVIDSAIANRFDFSVYIARTDTAVGLVAVKLELGSMQTLAHQENGVWVLNEAPDYAREYMRCLPYSPTTGDFVGVNYVNDNLLDNWYFGSADAIVDQRGGWVAKPGSRHYYDTAFTNEDSSGAFSSYINVTYVNSTYCRVEWNPVQYVKTSDCVRGYTGAGYTIDRWIARTSGVCKIENKHISLSNVASGGYFEQRITNPERLSGQTITLSVLGKRNSVSNGWYITIRANETYSGIPSVALSTSTSTSCVSVHVTLPDDLTQLAVIFASFNSESLAQIEAVKLELGSMQTLAHQEDGMWVLNEVPDYGTELAKCQRYQVELCPISGTSANLGIGPASLTTRANPMVFLPVAMRAKPVIAIQRGTFVLQGRPGGGEVAITVDDLEVVDWNQNTVRFNATAKGLTLDKNYLFIYNSSASLLLDANL